MKSPGDLEPAYLDSRPVGTEPSGVNDCVMHFDCPDILRQLPCQVAVAAWTCQSQQNNAEIGFAGLGLSFSACKMGRVN